MCGERGIISLMYIADEEKIGEKCPNPPTVQGVHLAPKGILSQIGMGKGI